MIKEIKPFNGLSITFNTTEACNLACTYCYEINKSNKELSLENAKKFIDILFTDSDPILAKDTDSEWILEQGLILDFIGGDALMNVKLVDSILQYFQFTATLKKHRWAHNWRASISTNGTLFEKKEVRTFCEKYKNNLSIGISIDGCPEIHDACRVFPNGTGSMATIQKWLPWFRGLFGDSALSTKATCAKQSIPYLYKSLKYMHENLGLKWINQNFIFENMELNEFDLAELDYQLSLCTEYCLQHKDDLYWGMLADNFASAKPYSESDPNKSWCGSGSMPALAVDGKIYPCFRWLPHTQSAETNMSVGDCESGLYRKENFQKVRDACRSKISPEKCKNCEVESACSWCIAGCYAEYGNFKRQTHICEVIKLQVKWAKKLKELESEAR